MHPSDLSALALNCTLKPSPEPSSGDLMVSQFHAALRGHGLRTSSVRVVDHNVAPGVETDMGADDAWPRIREQVLAADVLVFVSDLDGAHVERGTARARTPRRRQWCRRRRRFTRAVRQGRDGGRGGKRGRCAQGHRRRLQALNDVGFTVPAQGATYWNGEAMHKTDYRDLDEPPDAVTAALATAVANGVHLARMLRDTAYPA